ncbi:MAG: DUF459 domain-containing protein [Bauldia sp.]|nr:DUF459 domain-containing protein [Bauldia sp.]
MLAPRKLIFALIVALIAIAVVLPDVTPAVAQEIQLAQAKKKRPGLFERLFGSRKKTETKRAPVVRKKSSAPVKRRSTSSSQKRRTTTAAPAVKTVDVVEKDENAHKILIVGDYLASGLAWGLDQALAKETKLAVVERTDGSSGLVAKDDFDWNQKILGILNEESPDVVVVALGANDRKEIAAGEETYPVGSEKWEEIYSQRVAGLVDTLNIYGRPFFWVSLPPLRGTEATADMAYFNGLYKPAVEKAGGHYVDLWNGFTNASGQFITSGPDIDGQVKALRTRDGVNYTSAGKLKLAYYVERDIRRETGFGAGAIDILASVTLSSTIEIGPDGKKRLVGPVLSLADPLPGGSGELAGEPDPVIFDPVSGKALTLPKLDDEPLAKEDETPQYRLIVKGEAPPTVVGRIDDFAWPPSSRESPVFIAPEAAEEADAMDETALVGEEGQGDGAAVLTPVSKSSQ